MGKEKVPPKLGIKTSRYFVKDCVKCGFEYPNWFTNCPKCGASWDEAEAKRIAVVKPEEPTKKNIKIVVKITEETFNTAIERVQLIFSADKGINWYQMGMDSKMDYFIAEIAEVPFGSVIIYYVEVYLANGEKVLENNSGNYFYYKVGGTAMETEDKPPQPEARTIEENIAQSKSVQREYKQIPEKTAVSRPQSEAVQSQTNEDITIFGTPQKQMDPDLKVCPKCNSKIKKMWTICPICGQKI